MLIELVGTLEIFMLCLMLLNVRVSNFLMAMHLASDCESRSRGLSNSSNADRRNLIAR